MKYQEYMQLSVNQVNTLIEQHLFQGDITKPIFNYMSEHSAVFAIMARADQLGYMVNLWADNSNGRYVLHVFPKFKGMNFVFAQHKGIVINNFLDLHHEVIGAIFMAMGVIDYEESATTFSAPRWHAM